MSEFAEWIREFEPMTETACDDLAELCAKQHEIIATYHKALNGGESEEHDCAERGEPHCNALAAAEAFRSKYS